MTRLAGITAIYAVVATLVLVAPLSASPEPDPAGGEAAPATGTEGEPVPAPETVPAEPAPAPEPAPAEPAPAPEPEPQPAPPPDPATAPADPPAAVQAEAAPEETTAPEERRAREDRPEAKAAASAGVTIRDFEYAPASVTVDVGDTVTWSNDGPTGHTATADDGSFDTGLLAEGESGSQTFDQAGSFSYFCEPHPFMKGTVAVQAAAGGGGDSGGSGGDAGGGSAGGEATADSDDDSGSALPATGLEPGGLAVLGLATLALGVWLRRRAGADH